jgi:hypothetical protein
MQPDLQARQPPRPNDGIRRIRFAHHQAGARQKPIAMRRLDSIIDRTVETEIIRRKDDPFQLAT